MEQHLLSYDGYEFRHNTKKVLFSIKGNDYLDFDDKAHLYDIREILLEDVASFWIDEFAMLTGLQSDYVMIYVYLKSSNYEDPVGVKRTTLQGFSRTKEF